MANIVFLLAWKTSEPAPADTLYSRLNETIFALPVPEKISRRVYSQSRLYLGTHLNPIASLPLQFLPFHA